MSSSSPSDSSGHPDSASPCAPGLDARELILSRVLDATPAQVYAAWTRPDLLTRWFTPAPYTTPHAELDVRVGGSNLVIMRDPQGNEYPNRGVYLEVVPGQRLVLTDAYTRAWEPAEKPFVTVILTFEPEGEGRTRYTARVRHWTVADREAHEKMGFHAGWGAATDQLAALLREPAAGGGEADGKAES